LKILTISKLKDIALTLPPNVFIPLMEVSVAVLEQQKKEGKILDSYYLPGSDRIMVMLNYDSAEKWAKDAGMIPILRYCDFTADPLVDLIPYMKDLVNGAKMAAAKMPIPPK
jgi:hypothetical protein